MPIDQKTIKFYNENALEYSVWSSKKDNYFELEEFCKLVINFGHILDFGCGSGWASHYFLNQNYFVTALDASKELLSTIEENDDLKKLHTDFSNIEFKNKFDGIWASFSLQHVPKVQIPKILLLLNDSLKSKAHIYIGIHEGKKICRDKFGRLYCYFQEQEIRDLLEKSNFKVLKIDKSLSKSFDDKKINIMHIFSQKVD